MKTPDVRGSSRQAEKEYLRRSGSAAWESVKPFAPEGASAVREGSALIQDFGACVALLDAQPHHRILDFGAGGCWAADWLQRLGLDVVAVDLSFDLLALGRDRLRASGHSRVVCGDGESLPFASGSFDRVLCLNAMHHMPNLPQALAEISRVLTDEGRAVFSEPGSGHADQAHAVRAVQDFGVQEADIDASRFLRHCESAGLRYAVLEPFAQVVPGHGLNADHWAAWSQRAAESRPRRALRTLRRAVLEFAGWKKADEIVAEAFASEALRVLHDAMRNHPIVVASKQPIDRFLDRAAGGAPPLSAAVSIVQSPGETRAGDPIRLSVDARNTGAMTWRADRRVMGRVQIGVQLLDRSRRLLDRDFARHPLPQDVDPGATVRVDVAANAPSEPGAYLLKIDLVSEGVTWFEAHGSIPAVCPLVVN